MIAEFFGGREEALTAAHLFSDGFIAEPPAISTARTRAAEIGTQEPTANTGAFLRWLTSVLSATNVVEVGTGAGVGALWLLQGMDADGSLTSIDSESEHVRMAREGLKDLGVPANRVRFIVGEAVDVLSRLTDSGYDLIVWRGAPQDLAAGIDQAHRLLRDGGVLLVDRALWQWQVPDPAQRDEATIAMREGAKALRMDERWRTALLPVSEGLLLATKLAGDALPR
jgi:predicted O-methyltransferase YrrM